MMSDALRASAASRGPGGAAPRVHGEPEDLIPQGGGVSRLIGLVLLVRCRPVPCHLECCDDVADGAGTGAEGAVTQAGAIAALEVPPHDPVAGHPAVGAGQQQAGCFGAGQPADVLTGYWG